MEDSGALITILGIVVVGGASLALLQYAPKIQQLLDTNTLGAAEDDPHLTALQPLYKVFYKFAHNSSTAWIDWILAQDQETQKLAFDKLSSYLEAPPEELGIATKEVIKAITRFKYPNSFEILATLLINIKTRLGQLKSIDLFYGDLCMSVLELDATKAIPILKQELELINDKDKTDLTLESFKLMIVKALASIKTADNELQEIYVSIIVNRDYSSLVRKTLIRGIKSQDDATAQYIYTKVLQSHLDSSSQVLNKDHQMVLEELFYNFKHLIKSENNEIWRLLLQSCYNESTQLLFMNLLTSMIANPQESLSANQLIDALNSEEPIKDHLRGALIERHQVTKEEQSIFRIKPKPEDVKFNADTIVIKKSKKTKTVIADLLPIYNNLEKALGQESDQTNKADHKAELRAKHSVGVLTGNSIQEKIYLLRGLAANTNRSFVYIDLLKMIHCTTELNKLISTISNSKPSIVYLDNLLDLLKKELDVEEEIGFKHLLKSIKELAILPTVTFYGGLSIPEAEIIGDNDLHTTIHSRTKGAYTILTNIDKPNQETKKTIIDDLFKKITPSRIDASFSFDKLLEETEGMSLIEFWSFIIDWLEKALMVHGKVT